VNLGSQEAARFEMTRVDEALARELARRGITHAFVLMTSDTAKLVVELMRAGLRVYTTRHEAAAIGMADGFARVSGTTGLAVVGRGPGLTNAMTALVASARARSRVVTLVGDGTIGQAQAAAREAKHLNQSRMLEGAFIPNVTLTSADSAISDLDVVLESASLGSTIVVNLPVDVLELASGRSDPQVSLAAQPEVPLCDEAMVSSVADLLETSWAARRPVILGGRGAVLANAREELIRLGDLTGSLLGTTLLAKALFRGHPFDLGIIGSFSKPAALELLHQADVVLAFGASLGKFTTYGGDVFPKARLVHVDRDATAFGRFARPDLTVLGDARDCAQAIRLELERRGHRAAGYRTLSTSERLKEAPAHDDDLVVRSESMGLDPRRVVGALDRILPTERAVVVDPGHHLTFSCELSVPDPASFILAIDSGAIGVAMGIAMGAAIARPDRPTVLCVGDGALMMSLGDLETIARYRLPVLTVVMNDSGFGAEIHMLRFLGLPDAPAHYPSPGFGEIAVGLGMPSTTVRSLEDLDALERMGRPANLPLLIDCRITQDVRGEWIPFHYGRN